MKISREGDNYSHFLFVDDNLLFTNGKSFQVKVVQDVQQKFCSASGLRLIFLS